MDLTKRLIELYFCDGDQVQERAREHAAETTELGQKRLAFWTHFLERYPEEGATYGPDAASSRWKQVDACPLRIVQYLARSAVGILIRAPRGGSPTKVSALLGLHRAVIEAGLGCSLGPDSSGYFLISSFPVDTDDRGTWDTAAEWLHNKA